VGKEKVNILFKTLYVRKEFNINSEKYREYRRQWSENPKNTIVSDFPLNIDIEATSQCNLSCTFCRTTYNREKYPAEYLDIDLYKKIVDEGAENGLMAVKFNWRGEPLLHPQLPEMVAYAKEKGIVDVFFNTNAQLLDKDKALKIINSGLDRITFSIEGYAKDVYEKNRKGADFDILRENVTNLFNIREEMGAKNPHIRIQTVLIPEIKDKLDEYVEFWKDYADEICCLNMKEEVDYDMNKGKIDPDFSCPQLWQRLVVACDGTVLPCNEDDCCLMVLGNAKKDSIKDLWHSEKNAEMRKLHMKKKGHLLKSCDRCPLRADFIDQKGREGK